MKNVCDLFAITRGIVPIIINSEPTAKKTAYGFTRDVERICFVFSSLLGRSQTRRWPETRISSYYCALNDDELSLWDNRPELGSIRIRVTEVIE